MTYKSSREEANMFVEINETSFNFRGVDEMAIALGYLPQLVNDARDAAHHMADSDRGMKVGAAAIAFDRSRGSSRIGVYSAGNYKIHPEWNEDYDPSHDVNRVSKNCAEWQIIDSADDSDMQRIPIIVVAATTRKKEIFGVNHVESATLHPCWEGDEACARTMARSSLIDDLTMLVTIGKGRGSNLCQVQSFAEYQARYEAFAKTGKFKDAPRYTYSSFMLGSEALLEYRQLVAGLTGRGKRITEKRRQAALTAVKSVCELTTT